MRRAGTFFSSIAVVACVTTAMAMPPLPARSTLLASDAVAYDAAATTLAIDGARLVFGARGREEGGINRGAVYVFGSSASGWSQLQKVTPLLAIDREEFGAALALRGNLLAVGAPKSDRDADDAGSAWVYESNGVSFVEATRLASPQPVANGAYGSAVAVLTGSTPRVVVGAEREHVGVVEAGRVHVYARVSGAWTLEASLDPGGVPTENDEFGHAVAASDDRIAVGSPGDDSSGVNAGAVYIFVRVGAAWSLETMLVSPTPESLGEFGAALALDGDALVVAAYREDGGAMDAGRAHVYMRGATGWQLVQSLLAPSPSSTAEFGRSVDLRDGVIAIGACRAAGLAPTSGAAFLFRRFATGNWSCVATVCSPEGQTSEFSGTAVGVSQLKLAFGAPLRSQPAAYQGAVFVADLAGDCNGDLTPDAMEIVLGAADCNANNLPDACDIALGEPDIEGNGIPDSCEVIQCLADLSGNNIVNATDIALFLSVWGTDGTKLDADFDGDGFVGAADLAFLLSGWGDCP